jgi:hypothetical protein
LASDVSRAMGNEQELRRVRGAQTICHLHWLIERAKEARGSDGGVIPRRAHAFCLRWGCGQDCGGAACALVKEIALIKRQDVE